ncbi:MAG TPA: TIGR03016 family PEP-CTERM system-associated outer membrane protein [Stellaceae bacterium]|nr:TIGR03016 family PEP-CTERM system-associated outer membrane protein [Stellaceae bacterium]
MRFLRSLAVSSLLIAVALASLPARAQTNAQGNPVFPDLQKLDEAVRQQETNPDSAPPSQGPFGEQEPLPTPSDHIKPPVDAPSPWLISPTIQLSETATDNAGFTHNNRQADLETFVNPSVSVTGDTNYAKVDLNYSPIYLRNVVDTSNDRFDQNFFGTGTFSVIPDAFFIDTRAAASEGSRSGSLGPVNPVDIRLNDRTEVLAYDAGPEWRFPLIEDATGDLRYSIGQTRFYNNTGALLPSDTGQPLVSSAISNGTLQDLRLYLDSGDRGNLISGQFTAEGTRDRIDNGGGTDDNGTIMVESQLRLSPTFQLLGSVGYEDIRYSQDPAANVNDPTWYAGARWQEAKDAYAQLTYGHKQGFNGFNGQLHYPLTPLTAAFADYGESVTTPQQQILDNLNNEQLTATNVVINPQTGLPEVLLVNELALQNSIFLDRTFRAGVVTTNAPDLYQLDVRYEDYRPIAGLSASDSFVGVEGLWQHAMNETTSFTLNGGYFVRQQFDESTFEMQASIGRYMTPSLLGSLGYQLIYGSSNIGTREYYQNSITAYLRQTF